MTVLKLLSKKRISRELFKVCRLEGFETLAQIEAHFAEHQHFDGLEWCGPAEKKELEALARADLKRLVARWELPEQLLETPSVLRSVHFLLEKEVLPEKQLQVLLSSFRIYKDSRAKTPAQVAAEMQLTQRSVRRLRKLALKSLGNNIRALQCMQEEMQQRYGLDLTAPLLFIDEQLGQQINAEEGTKFSHQFLGLLFGEYLEAHFSRLGNAEEVLAGNLLSAWHPWKHLYLLRNDLAAALDVEMLMKESFRLLRHSEVQQLNFRTFVSHFVRIPAEETPTSAAVPSIGSAVSAEGRKAADTPPLTAPVAFGGSSAVSTEGYESAVSDVNGKSAASDADPSTPASAVGRSTLASDADRSTPASAAGHSGSFCNKGQEQLEELLPAVAEILKGEFGFTVDARGQLLFPQRKPLLLRRYAQEALEALGEPSRLEVIRHKVEELHPEVVVDSNRFDLVLLDKWGFTYYKHVYALKKWFGGKRLKALPPRKLQSVVQSQPKRTPTYWKEYWLQQLEALEAFTREHSRLPGKQGPVEEKFLANWLRRQMDLSRKGELSAWQQQRYDAFREAFPVRAGKFWEALWLERFEELKAFAKRHSRRPSRTGQEEEEQRLHHWFKNQRVDLNKGELSIEQSVLLKEFTRRYPLKPLSGWEFRFKALLQFTETHSRLPTLESQGEEKRLHYFWLYLLDRKNQGKFTAEQEARITGLKQKYPYNAAHHKIRWDGRFEELQAFVAAHGVPTGHHCKGKAKTLRGWLIAQRIRMKKGELDSRQQRLLREFDRQYEQRGKKKPLAVWDGKFQALVDFTETSGRLPRPEEAPAEEQVLYRWLMTQRGLLKRSALEQRQELQLRDFMQRYPLKDADYHLARWHGRFDGLEQFAQAHDRLPFSRPKAETPLYQWLLLQQQKATAGKLNPGQLERLQKLVEGYKKKNQLDLYWDARYAELGAFVAANGRLPRKSTENSLWAWYRKQLKRLKNGRLNSSQARSIKRLRRW